MAFYKRFCINLGYSLRTELATDLSGVSLNLREFPCMYIVVGKNYILHTTTRPGQATVYCPCPHLFLGTEQYFLFIIPSFA